MRGDSLSKILGRESETLVCGVSVLFDLRFGIWFYFGVINQFRNSLQFVFICSLFCGLFRVFTTWPFAVM